MCIKQIKGSFASRTGRPNSNPYSRGNICANYCYVLCSPRPPSLLGIKKISSLNILF